MASHFCSGKTSRNTKAPFTLHKKLRDIGRWCGWFQSWKACHFFSQRPCKRPGERAARSRCERRRKTSASHSDFVSPSTLTEVQRTDVVTCLTYQSHTPTPHLCDSSATASCGTGALLGISCYRRPADDSWPCSVPLHATAWNYYNDFA